MKVTVQLLLLLILIPTQLFSQKKNAVIDQDQPLRIEIPAKTDQETYRVIPCGSDGVMVFFRSLEMVDAVKSKWYFTWYDNNLQQVWVKSVALLSDQEFRFQDSNKDTLSILFVHAGKSKAALVDFQVLQVLLKKGTFILNTGKIQENQQFVSFSVFRNLAWIGINSPQGMGQFLFLDIANGKSRSFPLGQGTDISIRWAQPDTVRSGINAIVTRQVSKKLSEHYLVRYDTAGTIRNESLLSTNSQGREFTHFRCIALSEGSFLVLGGYGQGTGASRKKEEELVSTGFFSCRVSGGAQTQINFYNFLEFKNVNSLMGEKDVMALRKKSLKKGRSLGEYSVDFPLMFQDILRNGNQYVLVAEVYTPQYRTESFTDFDFYGRPYTNSYSVFDGFRFQNAIVSGFDGDGKILWDNVLETRNLISFEPTPKALFHAMGDDIVLSFVNDGKIGYKIIQESKVLEKLDYVQLDLLHSEDKLVTESRSRMVYWYDNYFLCYGYQEIKNIALDGNNKRLVFYINKVRFEK